MQNFVMLVRNEFYIFRYILKSSAIAAAIESNITTIIFFYNLVRDFIDYISVCGIDFL